MNTIPKDMEYADDARYDDRLDNPEGTGVMFRYDYDRFAFKPGTTQAMSYSPGSDLLTLAHSLSGTGATYTNSYTKAHPPAPRLRRTSQILTEVASNASWHYLPAVFETTTYGAPNAMNQYVVVTQGANPTVTLIGACPGRGFAETRGCQWQSHQRRHLDLCL